MSGAERKSDSDQHAERVKSLESTSGRRLRVVAVFVLVVLAMGALLVACGGSSSTHGTTSTRPTRAGEPSRAFVTTGPNGQLAKLGEESTPEEREAASTAIEQSLDYRAETNFAGQCKTLAPKFARQTADRAPRTGPRTCAASIEGLARGAKPSILESTMVEPIVALRVKGDRGFAFYYGKGHEKYVFPMERVGGRWKPASLGGLPLVPTPQ